ncbi:putative phage abortive infection protein [Psychrobium sp. nBUS_13]|uniref:putative phage abortive infection protein n=1 Tax=Psychrobium sp. nBUS_13 TaxID=3395319 RepID=UPI003EBB88C0
MNILLRIVGVVVLVAALCIGFFIHKFGIGYWDTVSDWGATGDFFGGILNPIIALTSLFLIMHTLIQNQEALAQTKEALEQSEKAIEQSNLALEQNKEMLKINNEELRMSRDELSKTVDAQEEQAKHAEMQRFEDTFFSLLEYLNGLKLGSNNNFKEDLRDILQLTNMGHEKLCERERHNLNLSCGKSKMSNYPYVNEYFRALYQVLKFVALHHPENEAIANVEDLKGCKSNSQMKTYSSILRSALSGEVILLLALNCYETEGVEFNKYKILVEYFSMFEHIHFKYVEVRLNSFQKAIDYYYEKGAFGDNKIMAKMRNEK